MINALFTFPKAYKTTAGKNAIPVSFIKSKDFSAWLKKQSKLITTQVTQSGFEAKPKSTCVIRNKEGAITHLIAGRAETLSVYDSAHVAEHARTILGEKERKKTVFTFKDGLSKKEQQTAYIGWGLAAYRFEQYKKTKTSFPALYLPKSAPAAEAIKAEVEAVSLIRNLVNTPASDMGTQELEAVVKKIGTQFKAKVKSVVDKDLLKQNFPMLYHVGKASPRRPRLVELNWGRAKDPKITIVGKGIVFDTGGLDLKPPRFMRLMKKDMGGAAQAIGLAYMIMALKLPIRLQLLICAAENSVDGNAFRPGDILTSRKGHTVEVGDTDAEGRLAIGDALTYATEAKGKEKAELIVDFCTLTGAARVALGPDIPALLANNDKTAQDIVKLSFETEDPVWQLPLYQPYFKSYSSDVADFANDGDGYGGAIKAGLFLQQFAGTEADWVHIDCFAWSQSNTPGRPSGGADSGMRTIFHYLKKRYKS